MKWKQVSLRILGLLIFLDSQFQELHWSKVNYQGSPGRHTHSSTLIQDYIITFGGIEGGNPGRKNEVYAYNIKTGVWKQITPTGIEPATRQRHSACLYNDNEIIVFGGWNYCASADTLKLVISFEETSKNSQKVSIICYSQS